MTQEDKDLLIKDLSARLPYGVKGIITFNGDKDIFTVKGIFNILFLSDTECSHVEDFKPYLRPMSSMTEEEKKELKELHFYYADAHIVNDEDDDFNPIIVDEVHCSCIIDWLNKHHFDYRGLISKDLAIEVTEENNPYKE